MSSGSNYEMTANPIIDSTSRSSTSRSTKKIDRDERQSTLGRRATLLKNSRMSLGGPASHLDRESTSSTIRQSNITRKPVHKMLLSSTEAITMMEDIRKKQNIENENKEVSWYDYIMGRENEKIEEDEKELFNGIKAKMTENKNREKENEYNQDLEGNMEYISGKTGKIVKPMIYEGKIVWRRVFKKRYIVPIIALGWMTFSSWIWYWHNPKEIKNWSQAFFYTVEIGMGIGFDNPDLNPLNDFLCIFTFFFILIGSLLFSTVAGYFFEYVIQTTASMKEKEKRAFIEKLEGHDANMLESVLGGNNTSIEYDIYFGDGNLDENDLNQLGLNDSKASTASFTKKDVLLEIDGFSLSVVVLVLVFIFLGAWIGLTINPSDPPLTVSQAFLMSISAIQSTGIVQPNLENEWTLFVFSLFCLLGQPVYCLGMAVFATAVSLDNSKKMAKRELILKEKTKQRQFNALLGKVMNRKKANHTEIIDYSTFLELEILRLGIAPQEILDEIKASYDLMVEQYNLEYEEDSHKGEMNVYEQSPYLKSLPDNIKSRFQNDYDQWSEK